MTNNRNYYLSSNYADTIPTREEFHRYASNELSEGDFCTSYPSGYQVDRVAYALKWTINNEKKRNTDYVLRYRRDY